MSEGLIRFCHAMRVVFLFHGTATVFGGIFQEEAGEVAAAAASKDSSAQSTAARPVPAQTTFQYQRNIDIERVSAGVRASAVGNCLQQHQSIL